MAYREKAPTDRILTAAAVSFVLLLQAPPALAAEASSSPRPETRRPRLDISAGLGSPWVSEGGTNIGASVEATFRGWGPWGISGRSDLCSRSDLGSWSGRGPDIQTKTLFGGFAAAYQFKTDDTPAYGSLDIAAGLAVGWFHHYHRLTGSSSSSGMAAAPGSVNQYDRFIWGPYLSVAPTLRIHRFLIGLYFSGMIASGAEPIGWAGRSQRQIGVRLGLSLL